MRYLAGAASAVMVAAAFHPVVTHITAALQLVANAMHA